MTTNEDLDQIVNQYLTRLEIALADLPTNQKRQLIESITVHINEARTTLAVNSEVALRDILDRVGQPDDIAVAASADQATPVHIQAIGRRRGIVTGVATSVVVLIALGTFLVSRSNHNVPSTTVSVTTSTVTSVSMPDVIGLPLATAEAELQRIPWAFEVEVVADCTSRQVPFGAVAFQTPQAGTSVARNSQVLLKSCPPRSKS